MENRRDHLSTSTSGDADGGNQFDGNKKLTLPTGSLRKKGRGFRFRLSKTVAFDWSKIIEPE